MNINGYKFSGIKAGIKKDGFDLGFIYSEKPALCVAAFTKNLLKSNSIIVSKNHLKKTNHIRGIIVNSGCANTACGINGIKNTEEICSILAKKLNFKKEEILIASTGVIGEPLPTDKIIFNLDTLINSMSNDKNSILSFSRSIMTTDTKPKFIHKTFVLDGKKINILCFAKGAGMIAPKLEFNKHATMLVFLLTDLKLPYSLMSKIMKKIIIPDFNSFSIDGDTSPNDTIFFLSNGFIDINLTYANIKTFIRNIKEICEKIILKLLFDGEGVTKVIKLIIKNLSLKESLTVFNSISSSLLVKTAIHGADPNWGRILSVCGRSGVDFDINKISIWIGKYQVVKNGNSNHIPDKYIRKEMQKKFYSIIIDFKKTKNQNNAYTFYTTDLSKKYVEINSMYKT
ncbi:MAG: bifunctional glutamate N-acetyltransferase/amino-acid acetyltransferase ArgJ [Endomicrobiia bacterium]